MAGVIVTCPECKKKFKPKADVQGKKIKCFFCKAAFVVPAANGAKPDADKKAAAKSDKGKPDAKPGEGPSAPTIKSATEAELEADLNPYDVKHVDLVPRCPNCTQEMEDENATICLYCGYNTMTREWGRTEKTLGVTFSRQFMYLLPAIGSATFAIFTIIGMVYNAVLGPYDVQGTMMEFTNHESMRMWSTVFWLFVVWVAGVFCFKKFIEKPKPDEIKLD